MSSITPDGQNNTSAENSIFRNGALFELGPDGNIKEDNKEFNQSFKTNFKITGIVQPVLKTHGRLYDRTKLKSQQGPRSRTIMNATVTQKSTTPVTSPFSERILDQFKTIEDMKKQSRASSSVTPTSNLQMRRNSQPVS